MCVTSLIFMWVLENILCDLVNKSAIYSLNHPSSFSRLDGWRMPLVGTTAILGMAAGCQVLMLIRR